MHSKALRATKCRYKGAGYAGKLCSDYVGKS